MNVMIVDEAGWLGRSLKHGKFINVKGRGV